jgi:hypothetical protein
MAKSPLSQELLPELGGASLSGSPVRALQCVCSPETVSDFNAFLME